jgi:hypothetical protein
MQDGTFIHEFTGNKRISRIADGPRTTVVEPISGHHPTSSLMKLAAEQPADRINDSFLAY